MYLRYPNLTKPGQGNQLDQGQRSRLGLVVFPVHVAFITFTVNHVTLVSRFSSGLKCRFCGGWLTSQGNSPD